MTSQQKNRARQHLGGLANFSGNVFESQFAIWRVLLALRLDYETSTATGLALHLKAASVDDWVEEKSDGRHHHQLKRKQQMFWGEVRDDFLKELQLGAASVTLVVSSAKQLKTLRKSRRRVQDARVVYFPQRPTLSVCSIRAS